MDTYETSIYTAVVITAVLLGAVIGLFTWSLVRSQKRYYLQKTEAYQAEIQLLEERNRIARDLHDELGPVLSITRMQVHRANKEIQCSTLLTAEENIQRIASGLKRIAINLQPFSLLHQNLPSAVREFLHRCEEAYPIQFVAQLDALPELPVDYKHHLFCIVQEAVHNSIKHAGANKISVCMKVHSNRLVLHCCDDGTGVPDGQPKGIGTTSLRDRTLALRGVVHCYSSPEKGTSYQFQIPLP